MSQFLQVSSVPVGALIVRFIYLMLGSDAFAVIGFVVRFARNLAKSRLTV